MTMTKAQQSYALSKISTLIQGKVQETKDTEGWPRKSLTYSERHAFIVSGKVKLKKDLSKCGTSSNVAAYFDFSKYEKEAGMSKKGQTRIDLLLAAQEKATDEVMLGDSAEALALLESIKSL